jgi:hypothetical protein
VQNERSSTPEDIIALKKKKLEKLFTQMMKQLEDVTEDRIGASRLEKLNLHLSELTTRMNIAISKLST